MRSSLTRFCKQRMRMRNEEVYNFLPPLYIQIWQKSGVRNSTFKLVWRNFSIRFIFSSLKSRYPQWFLNPTDSAHGSELSISMISVCGLTVGWGTPTPWSVFHHHHTPYADLQLKWGTFVISPLFRKTQPAAIDRKSFSYWNIEIYAKTWAVQNLFLLPKKK